MKTVGSLGLERHPGHSTQGAGARAILLTVGCALAPLGAPVASDPTMPPAHLSPHPINWAPEQLTAYAATAAAAVEAEVKTFVKRYARAQRDWKNAALIEANEDAIRTAIRETGLTLPEFDAIQRAVQGDPQLHARVREIERGDWSASPLS